MDQCFKNAKFQEFFIRKNSKRKEVGNFDFRSESLLTIFSLGADLAPKDVLTDLVAFLSGNIAALLSWHI